MHSIKAGSNTTAGKDNGTDGQYTFTRRNSGGGGSPVSSSYGIAVVDGIVNGTVSASAQTAAAGDTVTITVTPAAGYQVATVTVTDANGKAVTVNAQTGGKYTFTMPSAKVEINATFVASAGLPFTDVAADAWYYEAVEYVYNADLMNGVSDALFAPDQTTTRGMAVTVLYRLAGNPAISAGSETFNDVQAGQYYADAAIWAANNGIVNGYGDGSFGPEDLITREQLAAIFYRYSSAQGYDVTASGDLSQFSDAGTISAYAEPALAWANGAGLINGRGNGLEPQANATRAEIATMLMRFCQSVAQ